MLFIIIIINPIIIIIMIRSVVIDIIIVLASGVRPVVSIQQKFSRARNFWFAFQYVQHALVTTDVAL